MEQIRRIEQCAAASRHVKLCLTKDEVEPPLPYDLHLTIDTLDHARTPGVRYLFHCGGLLRIVNISEKVAWLSQAQARTLGRIIIMEWQLE